MLRRTGRLALLTTFLVAVLAPAAPSPAAEETPLAAHAELVRLAVRPGHEAEFERFLARLAEGARRTGAALRWTAHRRVDGERPLYVLVLRGSEAELDAWGELTASDALERAYGAEEARRLLALREAALEGVQRERFVALPALALGN